MAEALCLAHFIREGWWAYISIQGHQPCDIIAVHPDGKIILIDVKREGKRVIKNRKKATRINRCLNARQKLLGVRLCYVNTETGQIDLQ